MFDAFAYNWSSFIQIFISRKLFIIIIKAHHFFPFFPSGALAGAYLAGALAYSGAFAGALAGATGAFVAGADLAGAAVLAGAATVFAGAVFDGAADLAGATVLAGAAGATGASTDAFLAFFSFKYLERSFS